ncbi:hypothetical protein [Krasilnikovia sp. MM14-A1259]|uniref:hypothetical protein n=1 Tax=Krasilnikovia sp. MM14-A1259 TaxID=3373539 RepID=UPI00399CBA28
MTGRGFGCPAAVVEAACWWVALTVAYASTLSVATLPELLVAVGCGAACAVAAVAARRAARLAWAPAGRWLSWAGPLAVAVVADTFRLLTRFPAAKSRVRTLPQPSGEQPQRAAFRRAWGTFVLSASPGTVVLDWPDDGAPVRVHMLASGWPDLGRVVMR